MILVVNAGSSNVKIAVYDQDAVTQLVRAQVDNLQDLYAWLQAHKSEFNITSIGHRIVHGGSEFLAPVILNSSVIARLKKYIPLAPLHQPHNLAAVEFFMQQMPNVIQVGCFDTAFHTTQLRLEKEFAIPQELTDEGVIRYGFHGLSYEYIASVAESKIGAIARQRVVVAHLGNGSSMCAMHNLQSVATTMGFSALDGLMMGTRCGNIDPGVLLFLLQEKRFNGDQLSSFLYNDCGLKGVSTISNDVRELLNSSNPKAKKAIDLYCYKAASELGKLLLALQGFDVLIFTAGIGENAAAIREGICKHLQWLGVMLNSSANVEGKQIISAADSKILVAVIQTDEELIIAQHVKNIM